jgi:hypothetical protein
LDGEAGEEFGSVTKVAPTSGEEETCTKSFLIGACAGDRTSNGRFTSASDSIQPKDARTIRIFAPRHDLLEEVYSCFG